MIKKSMLAACLAALAFAALPALAAAEETNHPGDPHLVGLGANTHFTIAGGVAKLTGASKIECEKVKGEGEFEDPETGFLNLTFEKCKGPFGLKCGNEPDAASQAIVTTQLPFHLKTVVHEGVHTPGVLLTPGGGTTKHGGPHFATFKCELLGTVEVGGNGIVGTITSPGEEKASKTATISFSSISEGSTTQTHRTVTNGTEEYDLKASINGGATATAAEDATATMTFDEGEPEIQTTPTE